MMKQSFYKRLPWIRLIITFMALLVISFCLIEAWS
jgi:hypothetical protein